MERAKMKLVKNSAMAIALAAMLVFVWFLLNFVGPAAMPRLG